MKEKPKKSVRMWVARDEDRGLYLYLKEPEKRSSYWIKTIGLYLALPRESFPNVRWEDNKPTRVYIRIA